MSDEEIDKIKIESSKSELDIIKNSAELIEEAQNKADDHWNELLRAKAEMENMRRRQARDLENAHKHA